MGNALVNMLLILLVVGIILALIWYVADALPIPQPFNKLFKIVAMVFACLIMIILLLNLAGGIHLSLAAASTAIAFT